MSPAASPPARRPAPFVIRNPLQACRWSLAAFLRFVALAAHLLVCRHFSYFCALAAIAVSHCCCWRWSYSNSRYNSQRTNKSDYKRQAIVEVPIKELNIFHIHIICIFYFYFLSLLSLRFQMLCAVKCRCWR